MSEDPPANGRRAALAMDAVSLYARSSPREGSAESTFFFDFDREALPGGGQDRLAALLCGLMHYADRRSLSFPGALAAARPAAAAIRLPRTSRPAGRQGRGPAVPQARTASADRPPLMTGNAPAGADRRPTPAAAKPGRRAPEKGNPASG